MDQIVQHITRRVDSFKADQDFQLELLKADLVAYVESKCASLVASSSSSSTSTAVGPSGSIPQPPTSLVVPQPANSVARSIDSLAQQPTALVQQPSDHNSTTPSQSSTLSVNAEHSDPRTVPNCTVAKSTNASSIPLVITNPVREHSTAPSSSSEVVVASTSNLPEQSQQQQQQQLNVTREGEVKIEVKEEDDDDDNVCRCDDMAHNLAPNGPPSTSIALSNGASTSASSQRSSKSGSTRKRALSVNKHHHHRSNKKPALTAHVDDEEDDDESDDDETNNDDDNDSDYEVEEEGDENDEEESDNEVDDARVDEDENGDEEDEEEEENQQQDRPAAQVITCSLRCPRSNCPVTELAPGRQFSAHMRTAHSILAYACAVRGCSQSFSGSRTLGHHIVHSHQSISKWHCSQCSHHYPSYKLLVHHQHYQHQLGHFECAFHGCTFRGQYKRKVVDHYVQQHKRTFKCGQWGCQYETPSAANLKQHQRIHSGIKPYRCTWPDCRYAATKQSHAIRHIRRHFERDLDTGSDGAQLGDPKDFLKVMHDLLK